MCNATLHNDGVELAQGAVVAGKYRLDRPLGEGGMGIVWAATHTVTGKSCALKFLKDTSADEASSRERFLREARAACAIRHPNVAPVHDVLESEGRPFMVMDLLDGEPLSRSIARNGKLPLEEAARVLVPIIDAVSAIHSQSIVHRDLKPDNVFVTRRSDGALDVKVLDFGIAKMTLDRQSTSTPTLTATGAMIGTPFYMAPEQIFGDKDIDARADVWALGVILYECLTGKRPTEGDGVGQVLKVITTDSITPLDRIAPELPADVSAIVMDMLSRDKNDRPSLDEVRAILAKHVPLTTAPPMTPRVVVPGDASPIAPTRLDGPVSAREPDSERWPTHATPSTSRSKKLLWAAIMVGTSGLAVALFFNTMRSDRAPSSTTVAATAASRPADLPGTATGNAAKQGALDQIAATATTIAPTPPIATMAKPTASVATSPSADAGSNALTKTQKQNAPQKQAPQLRAVE